MKHMKKHGIAILLASLTSVCISFTCLAEKQLQIYDAGDRVEELQKELISQGYLNGVADGLYGGQTQAAVAAYQQANGLEATGTADEETLSKLFPDGINVNEETTTTNLESTGNQLVPGYNKLQSFFFNISADMSRDRVINLGNDYGLHVYTNEYDSERSIYEFSLFASARECTKHISYASTYEFGKADYVEIYFEVENSIPVIKKVIYNFGKYVEGVKYNVEYWTKGNMVGNHYFVNHGYVSIDPTADYASLQEAFDTAKALYD